MARCRAARDLPKCDTVVNARPKSTRNWHFRFAEFEKNLRANLYKLWNRLASGSYFPPPVRRVDIPKRDGRTRPLGIPTVANRIAQMVGGYVSDTGQQDELYFGKRSDGTNP